MRNAITALDGSEWQHPMPVADGHWHMPAFMIYTEISASRAEWLC